MTYSFPNSLLFEKRENIAYMTINRPEAMNALLPETLEALDQASKVINEDPDIYVAVITGSGDKAFCAGADLKASFTGPESEKELSFQGPTKRTFSEVTKPIISAINGYAIGGGVEIMLGTDIRVACEEASFGLQEVRWSLIPVGGGCVRLPRQIPWAMAMELLLIGDRISAQEAFRFGLINRVVKREDLMTTAEKLAVRISQNGPYAVRKAKEVALRSYNMGWDEAYFTEHSLGDSVFASEDAKEGPKAFAEKRKPKYKNR